MTELDDYAYSLINKKYNVLFSSDCRKFDLNFQLLSDNLEQIKKDNFNSKDRILFVHMDTDFYDELLSQGLIIINIVRLFKEKNIPLFTLLFVTNHYGISKEFDALLENHDINDRPTIIETLLSKVLLSNNIDTNIDFNFDEIIKPGLSMMGQQRSHRIALCNFLNKNNLLSKIALKTNFT
jgi:hypothetical protein